jgi:hypothetical protein
VCALACAAPAIAGPRAASKQVMYVGVHPIPAAAGGGFCDIEGPHVHVFLPEHADVLFRTIGGAYLFVGDPAAFGYDGPKHAFYGRHPIPVDELVPGEHPEHDGTVFCYLDGPHYHAYAPPPSLKFVERGDAYWYVGDWPRSYRVDGPRYQKINAVYKPLVYARPVVVATAPPGYHVPTITVDVAPAVVVRTPQVIEVPAPWLVVDDGYVYEVRYGRHHHHHHHHHHEDDDD